MSTKLFLPSLLVVFMVSAAYADPPRSISVSFNGTEASIVVYHPVPNPKVHYINRVAVRDKGKLIADRSFISQEGNYQNLTQELPPEERGRELVVRGYCNIWGAGSQRIRVP
jgi:hypothetical protein